VEQAKKNWQDLRAGDAHYKAYVGPPKKYDLLGALQFTLLTAAGLRSHHRLCDIGCGSLRAGKLLIPYLETERYCGIDPERWLVEEVTREELGRELMRLKGPRFHYSDHFDLTAFGQKFDFLLAQSVFSHAAPQQIKTCLQAAVRVMQEDAYFLATFMTGAEDYQGSEWVYPGCVTYREDTIRAMAEAAGLTAFSTDWPHPNGQQWYLLMTKRAGRKAPAICRFSLAHYAYETSPAPAEPSLWEKLKYHWKRRIKF